MPALVAIGVFGLFHPVELRVEPVRGRVLVIETNGRRELLEGSGSVTLRSAATVTESGKGMSGRNRLVRVRPRWARGSSCASHSLTRCCAQSDTASAVPHAPAPRIEAAVTGRRAA